VNLTSENNLIIVTIIPPISKIFGLLVIEAKIILLVEAIVLEIYNIFWFGFHTNHD
jgi:hypothetical protein